MKKFYIMPKISLLLGLLLAIGGCHNMHHRLGVIADEKKETEQLTPEAWFNSFVDATDSAREVQEVHAILELGKKNKYLNQCVAWRDDAYTPLHYAAQEGKLKIVKELVDQEIPVDIRTGDFQRTPLHLAAQEGHLEVVKFLIEQCGAQWEKMDKESANTLHYAASGTEGDANAEVVKYLLEAKSADPTTKVSGFNILYIAIKVNNPELARYLVTQYPVLTSDVCEENISPLEFARATGKRTIANIIEKAVKNFLPF